MSYQSFFVKELKQKWWIIAIFIIIFGVAVGIEKTYFGKQVIKTSALHAEKTIQVVYDKNYNNDGTEFNYNVFFRTYSEMNRFLEATSDTYDYSKFDANWGRYDLNKKLKWLQNHIFITNINDGVVQYAFGLGPEEPKDYQYTKDYGEKFLDTYVAFSEERLKTILPVEKYTVVDELTILPKVYKATPNNALLKYGSAGGVLGLVIGCFIIAILAMRKYRNGRC